jgi:hypothetical protein
VAFGRHGPGLIETPAGHGRPHTILEYPEAGHSLRYLLPELPPGLLPREITDEAADKAARANAWPKAVEFIRELGAPKDDVRARRSVSPA